MTQLANGAIWIAFFEIPTRRCAAVDQLAKTQKVYLALNSKVFQLILTQIDKNLPIYMLLDEAVAILGEVH